MDRRTFIKATSAAVALVAMPLGLVQKAVSAESLPLAKGTYFRFPNGLEFVLMEERRRLPAALQFHATHIFDFKRGGWMKNRWRTGVYPHTNAELQFIRRVTYEDLFEEGILYRISNDSQVSNMATRVKFDRVVGRDMDPRAPKYDPIVDEHFFDFITVPGLDRKGHAL